MRCLQPHLVVAALIAFSCTEHVPADGQLGASIEWVKVPGEPGRFWMTQKSTDGRLLLTPNEAFFPRRGLKAEGDGAVPDIANLNGGKSFAEIRGWNQEEQAEWALWFPKRGEIVAAVSMTGKGSFSLALGDQRKVVSSMHPATFQINEPGAKSLRLTCESRVADASIARIEISGDAAIGSAVIRKRWRPAAAHTKFRSSKAQESIRLWIMEMDAHPGELDFYSPITTPFGYYGPTWKADGTVNTGFNFSLWSYARGQSEPPIEKLSHLIAIGNPNATFGGFGHEGTGVKIRDWEPLKGRQGQRQTFALRVEPGEVYDTYYSYFFSSDEKRWRLFGAGRKFNKGKPLRSLWVGSFVEVPGPPHVQRTGLYARRMRYRGWVMDVNDRLFPLDRMSNGNVNRETGLTHTDRGVNGDGWFFLETGGWTFRQPPNNGNEIQMNARSSNRLPDYLDREVVRFLKTVPCEITATRLQRNGATAQVSFNIRGPANSEVVVYWGSREGLTFRDRWENNARIRTASEGPNQFTLRGIDAKSPLYVRLFLKNDEGQFWSTESLVAESPR